MGAVMTQADIARIVELTDLELARENADLRAELALARSVIDALKSSHQTLQQVVMQVGRRGLPSCQVH